MEVIAVENEEVIDHELSIYKCSEMWIEQSSEENFDDDDDEEEEEEEEEDESEDDTVKE